MHGNYFIFGLSCFINIYNWLNLLGLVGPRGGGVTCWETCPDVCVEK